MKRHGSMNHIFRLVWSHALNGWVAVAEKTRGRGKSSSRKLVAAAVASMAAVLGSDARAAPSGAQVMAGASSIVQAGATTTITQTSQNLALNWKNFNIAAQETVNFIQPTAASVAVNRIFDTNGTQILGHLNANGQVYLINPNGLLFGKDAQVNVGALVASTLDINAANPTGASTSFSGSGSGSVVNQGVITAANYVALLGNQVSNQGLITAQMGTVALGAGSAATLTFGGNRLLTMQVDQSVLNSLSDNKGLIQADGGQVIMTAGARDALLASTVNNTGVILARTMQEQNGVITLTAGMAAGSAATGGTLDVSSAAGNGGQVVVTAHDVHIADGARVDATGNTGGGAIHIGGGWQGSGSIAQASTVLVAKTALLDASATHQGNGGEISVWSDVSKGGSTTRAYGTLRAKGGAKGGDGGRIETSGHWINVDGIKIEAAAVAGKGGEWLIDPYDVIISNSKTTNGIPSGSDTIGTFTPSQDSNINVSDITSNLNSGISVTVNTGTSGSSAGNITVNSPILVNASTGTPVLTLSAAKDIFVNAPISNDGASTLGVTLNAITSHISSDITTLGGNVQINSNLNVGDFSSNPLIHINTSGGTVGGGTVVVSGQSVLTQNLNVSSGRATVIFGKSVNAAVPNSGNAQLTVNAGVGQVYFSGTVGTDDVTSSASNPLTALNVTAGEIAINGGKVFTIGSQNYAGKVTLSKETQLFQSDPNTDFIIPAGTSIKNKSTSIANLNITSGGGFVINGAGSPAGIDTNGSVFIQAIGPVTVGTFGSTGGGVSAKSNISVINYGVNSDVVINNPVTTTGGNITIVAGRNFTNKNAIDTGIVANGGRYLVYSTDPSKDTRGMSQYSKHYNESYNAYNTPGYVASSAGNWFLYKIAPVLSVTPEAQSIIYGNAPATSQTGYAGFIDGDSTSNTVISGSASFIIGGTKSLSGNYNAGSHNIAYDKGLLSNLGYTFADNATSVNELTVTPKALNATASASSKTYDGSANTAGTTAAPVLTITSGLVAGETVTATGSGTFNSQDVLSANRVTVNSTILTDGANGGLASNYSLASGQTASANITAKALNASASASNKTYDGSTAVTMAPTLTIDSTGFVSSETVTATATGTFNTKDVLSANLVTVNSATLANGANGGLASNYSLASGQTASAKITAKALSAIASASNKTYDGSTAATPAPLLAIDCKCFIKGETVTATATGSFNTKDVLTANLVTVDSATLVDGKGGGLASNYSLASGQTASAKIMAKALSATASALNKTYDGSTAATPMLMIASADFVNNETVTASATGSFNTKDVSSANLVTVNSTTLIDGANGGLASNYSLASAQTANASITAKALSATASASNKTYDGSTAATPMLTIASAGFANNETISASATGSFNTKDVLTANLVTVNSTTLIDGANGGLASNYSLASAQTANASITAKALSATASASNKTYDGSTAATPMLIIASAGFVNGETVTATGAGSFNTKDVLTANLVTVNSTTLANGEGGGQVSNYSLANGQTANASITAKALSASIGVFSKIYDGTTSATPTFSIDRRGLVGNETVIATGSAALNSKDVITAQKISVTSVELLDGKNGGLASNYSLNGSQFAAASIVAKQLGASVANVSKVYDGTTSVTPVLSITSGLVGSESVTAIGTASLNSKDVGSAKVVTVNSTALLDGANGGQASNYRLAPGQTALATLGQAPLLYTATALTELVGYTPLNLSGTVSGLVPGDTLAGSTSGALKWMTTATAASPAGAYPIDGSGLVSVNYRPINILSNATALTLRAIGLPNIFVNVVNNVELSCSTKIMEMTSVDGANMDVFPNCNMILPSITAGTANPAAAGRDMVDMTIKNTKRSMVKTGPIFK